MNPDVNIGRDFNLTIPAEWTKVIKEADIKVD